ncbi:hypothetical protein [Pyrobaculum neutrophilum]|uniref:Uncharacterized protein n=1 Tax=Pyrobaculum neutrophilum (strain DSM 2338 / JCM 9278 / NBRC 100436 / V24Sta) TaxID=444157 RepID=B1YAP0_PYRNV|nr:hypothetical protein [Pyrobaculum neutrophilum]ACB39119.1 conserved hypothetical protein [Pyrobaculum neutrophilum V24Sta]
MDRFDVVVGLAVVVFVSLVLSGLWSLFGHAAPFCSTLWLYAMLGALAGGSLLLSRWYRQLEAVGVGLTILYLLVMWVTYVNPGYLANC